MTFGMIDTEVRQQTREVRRQVTRGRMAREAQPAPAAAAPRGHPAARGTGRDRPRRPGLRSRVGFTLVETGLRLLASGHARG